MDTALLGCRYLHKVFSFAPRPTKLKVFPKRPFAEPVNSRLSVAFAVAATACFALPPQTFYLKLPPLNHQEKAKTCQEWKLEVNSVLTVNSQLTPPSTWIWHVLLRNLFVEKSPIPTGWLSPVPVTHSQPRTWKFPVTVVGFIIFYYRRIYLL